MPVEPERPHESTWLTDDPRPAPITTPSHTGRVDVIVVGGGLAGLLTAAAIHRDGGRVMVLDAGRIAGRTTGHSTAKLTALHGATYSRLRRGKGLEAAQHYAAANTAAVDGFVELLATLDVDARLRASVAYTCAATDEGVAVIAEELEAASAAGLPVYGTDESDLMWDIRAAVALGGQAHIDPVAACAGLAVRLRERGVDIVENCRVTGIEEDRAEGCTVHVGDRSHRSDVVVQTSHLPIHDPALIAGRVRPERSYVAAGPVPTPENGLRTQGMYLSIDEGWSVRPRHGGDDDWMLIGGEDHPMSDHVTSSGHYAALSAFAHRRADMDVRATWSAFDYVTVDGVPFIGRLAPSTSRQFVATGFAKWGMSHSMVAATILSDIIGGRDNPHAALYDAARILPTLGKDLARNTAQVVGHFVGDRLRNRSVSPIGVADGPDGRVHTVKRTCTHMGCIVQYNDGEQTWDCPCHGSRFALDGSVIDGPATAPLATDDD